MKIFTLRNKQQSSSQCTSWKMKSVVILCSQSGLLSDLCQLWSWSGSVWASLVFCEQMDVWLGISQPCWQHHFYFLIYFLLIPLDKPRLVGTIFINAYYRCGNRAQREVKKFSLRLLTTALPKPGYTEEGDYPVVLPGVSHVQPSLDVHKKFVPGTPYR